ncbi:hypothetical protein [Desulforhopalus sp. IMCC35007]|uniref:hypothetical protein n=1 Tax=Desulforhopalus sp. IMCC35007 TaxID=2569543 RepID=UPI0010AE93E0|nr:hypothetical protein [Desulforhopalus sp. IMCC35007]TKB06869.1 hypothetical protein FCL48_18920 [Desulforhopalus sp. IMCC35007]
MLEDNNSPIRPPDISEQDIMSAMGALQGYIDITPGDFKQIYQVAYKMAITRLLNTMTATQLMTKKRTAH